MRGAAVLLPLFVAGFCTGCFGPAPAAQFVQQAQRLHDGALHAAVTANTDLRDYVQLVGKRLIDAGRSAEPGKTHDEMFGEMQFHLMACNVPNVFATGGAHVYVYNGLFQLCRSEDELAAVMAHAYAHAVDLDVEHVGMEPDPNRTLPLVAWQFVTHRFTLAQEQSADELAFELYTKAGYDPSAMASLLERLSDRFPDMPDDQRAALPQRARLAQARASAALRVRRPLPVADPRTFESLRRQAAGLDPRLVPGDAELFLRAFPNCLRSGDTADQQAAQQQLKPPPPPPTRLEPS